LVGFDKGYYHELKADVEAIQPHMVEAKNNEQPHSRKLRKFAKILALLLGHLTIHWQK
jgi:hypothetical protein